MDALKNKPNISVGLLAHVDAGKTTLSEALLYCSGTRRNLGRVDHGDAYLDSHVLERARGITIFSKQALIHRSGRTFTLVDTPGHVDFSAEAERTMPILDCAILLISATDGVQAHTLTLWRLLEHYNIPTVLFINKMDLPGTDRDKLLSQLRQELSDQCVDFGQDPAQIREAAALCDEALLETYLETGDVTVGNIQSLIENRRLFPCLFGSALRLEGVEQLLSLMEQYLPEKQYENDFSARIYKISRDRQGNRLTWLKVTGGRLCVRTGLTYTNQKGETVEEKTAQLRLYSGEKFTTTQTLEPGQLGAVTGLTETYAGQGLGNAADMPMPTLEPVMTYQLHFASGKRRGNGASVATAAGGGRSAASSDRGSWTDPHSNHGKGSAGSVSQSGQRAIWL